MLPNKALELTLDPAALIAGAKSAYASSAAQLGRYADEYRLELIIYTKSIELMHNTKLKRPIISKLLFS